MSPLSEGAITSPSEGASEPIPPVNIVESRGESDTEIDPFVNIDTLGLRRSSRVSRAPSRLGLLILATSAFITPTAGLCSSATTCTASCFQSRAIAYEDFLERNFDGSSNTSNPLAQIYMTSQSNNENYTIKEMLGQPDKAEFLKAMEIEVSSMFRDEIWKLVPRTEMLQHYAAQRKAGISIHREQIMMIWSFKRKRRPDGTLNKYKARLCCHGGQQQWGVNYWDTYAPVVSWSSVRILLTIAKLHDLHTKSIDFVQAYPQADLKHSIYLRSPSGVLLNDDSGALVLKLLKNLYGLKDAGRTWYEHLTDGLSSMGFVATASDPCIFIKGTDMICLYVDDCIILSKSKTDADAIFKELEKRKYVLTDEGSMEEYLGIMISHNDDGSYRMSQPLLIDRIIESIPGMADARSSKTPACSSIVLTKDAEGESRKEKWNYRSVIGMLNYLVNCTHPEMSFAVHQCARFCNDPKRCHEQAVKRVIRYLLFTKRTTRDGTRQTQGIIYRPDKKKSIDTYVDAPFAGDWNTSWSNEPSSVMSRTGYVVMYANCPIIWCSKLQTEIALSTTESEYIALSQALRDVIPLIRLLLELQSAVIFSDKPPVIHCTVFEDNKGCIDLVTAPKMRPRTKHIALKYHHFRSFVQDKTVSIQYVETSLQIADIFTKALNDSQFTNLRVMLMGW